jgi:hypothetical protein
MNVTAEEIVTDVCRVPERSTRQSICSLSSVLGQHSAKCMLFAECWCSDTRQKRMLFAAGGVTLGKEIYLPSAA